MADVTNRADIQLKDVQTERDGLLAELARVKQDLGSETEKHSMLMSAHKVGNPILGQQAAPIACTSTNMCTRTRDLDIHVTIYEFHKESCIHAEDLFQVSMFSRLCFVSMYTHYMRLHC